MMNTVQHRNTKWLEQMFPTEAKGPEYYRARVYMRKNMGRTKACLAHKVEIIQ